HRLVRDHLHDHAGPGHALPGERVGGRAGLDLGVVHRRTYWPQTQSRSKKVEGIGERSSLASWGQTCRDPLFCAASLSLSLTNPLMRHIIAILLQNEAGALARVAGLFSTRGYNIESLSVAPTDDPTVSRLTLVTSGSDAVIQQIANQLN